MFNRNFYPTPHHVIEEMVDGIDLSKKIVYEPSAGKGDIVDYCLNNGVKEIIASELHPELRSIVASKCKVIGEDFLEVTSDQISHIDLILMNPPFSSDEHHIIHAYNIAPAGCTIRALCNLNTVKEKTNRFRRELSKIIESYGSWVNLGNCFSDGERHTDVEIALVNIQKAGSNYDAEFEGFFMDEEVEEQGFGMMPYNFVRDLVNRYIGAIKIYDEQLDAAIRMNDLTGQFFSSSIAISISEGEKPKARNDYKKDLQKAAWKYIFDKMNMQKYATKNLKEDINKFVEQQQKIPFTMKNIYRMLEIVIGTQSQRMDKVVLEVFDKLTQHYHDNRYGVEGWKTNSHYLINQKFIIDWMVSPSFSGGMELKYNSNGELIEDMMKALCHISVKDYNYYMSLDNKMRYALKLKNAATGEYLREDRDTYSVFSIYHDRNEAERAKIAFEQKGIKVEIEDAKPKWGEWFEWGFFECRGYKKGTMHFKFKDMDLWGRFNQRVAKIKGYPLFEPALRKETKFKKAA